MDEKLPIRIDDRIELIDGFDLGLPERTGTYVIKEEALTLIETGPSPSVEHIKQGLTSLGFSLDEVHYIIVTHVHLDHAGGAGLLLEECPNAQVVIHPRGSRHLADPSKLIKGAQAVYGESFSDLFDPIVPIPEERLLEKGEGDTLAIGENCTLEFLDTPGHAKHHFSIYDPISNGLFTGDTVGIKYEPLIDDGVNFYLPSTSPNHFDPEAMHASIKRVRHMNVSRIYFGHFGMTLTVDEALDQVSEWLDVFVAEGEKVMRQGKTHVELARDLLDHVQSYLQSLGVDDDHEVYTFLKLDMEVSSMGIIDYLQKTDEWL